MRKPVKIILIILSVSVVVLAALYLVWGCGPVRKLPVTSQQTETPAAPCLDGVSWLELPGEWRSEAEHCLTHYAEMEGRLQRNYTVLYDEDTYTSYWVAYPLCHSHTTTGREEIWGYDPKLPEDVQVQVDINLKYAGYIKRQMQQVAQLKVPLLAEAKWGESWYEAK